MSGGFGYLADVAWYDHLNGVLRPFRAEGVNADIRHSVQVDEQHCDKVLIAISEEKKRQFVYLSELVFVVVDDAFDLMLGEAELIQVMREGGEYLREFRTRARLVRSNPRLLGADRFVLVGEALKIGVDIEEHITCVCDSFLPTLCGNHHFFLRYTFEWAVRRGCVRRHLCSFSSECC